MVFGQPAAAARDVRTLQPSGSLSAKSISATVPVGIADWMTVRQIKIQPRPIPKQWTGSPVQPPPYGKAHGRPQDRLRDAHALDFVRARQTCSVRERRHPGSPGVGVGGGFRMIIVDTVVHQFTVSRNYLRLGARAHRGADGPATLLFKAA